MTRPMRDADRPPTPKTECGRFLLRRWASHGSVVFANTGEHGGAGRSTN